MTELKEYVHTVNGIELTVLLDDEAARLYGAKLASPPEDKARKIVFNKKG